MRQTRQVRTRQSWDPQPIKRHHHHPFPPSASQTQFDTASKCNTWDDCHTLDMQVTQIKSEPHISRTSVGHS